MTKRRFLLVRIALGVVLLATVVGPGTANAATFVYVTNTSTGGTVSHLFDHTPFPGCGSSFNERLIVHYGKVTNASIVIKSVDVYMYPGPSSHIYGNWLRVTNSSDTFYDVWDGTPGHGRFYSVVTTKTFTVNQTVPFTSSNYALINRNAAASPIPDNLDDGCWVHDQLYIARAG